MWAVLPRISASQACKKQNDKGCLQKPSVPVSETMQKSGGRSQGLPGASGKTPGDSRGEEVFIRSGIRFDYVEADKDREFLEKLAQYHVSGQLRVAPEHVSDQVLTYMGKPEHAVYEKFLKDFEKANARTGKKQYAVPYFMSSHPGCTMKEAVKLAEYVRDMGFTPEQVQDFYPTPSTMSTCMYYTGLDPRTMEPVYIPKNPHEKAMQRALIQYKNPANRELVKEALITAGRTD